MEGWRVAVRVEIYNYDVIDLELAGGDASLEERVTTKLGITRRFCRHLEQKNTAAIIGSRIFGLFGRGERIRTSDLSVPNRAHYQAVLRPDVSPDEIRDRCCRERCHSS